MASVKKLLRRAAIITPLKWVERAFLRSRPPPETPQLFILGLPRSGTTLIYQYLVHRLKVAYFTNAVGTFPKSPCAVTWWEQARHGAYRSDFKSNYGQAAGPSAPHEAGEVWARWFGYEEYRQFAELTRRQVQEMQATVAGVQRIFGDAPFVNKNVKHLLRIDALHQAFPAAAFLVVHRELPDLALSVLRARSAHGGDPRKWWSVKPPNYEQLQARSPARQVAGQLVALQNRMNGDLQAVPADRVRHVVYADFCQNPEGLIASLRTFWGEVPFRNPAVPHFNAAVNQPRTGDEQELAAVLAGTGLCSR